MKKRLFSFILAIMLLALPGCRGTSAANDSPTQTTYPKPEQVVESWRSKTEPVTLTFSSAGQNLIGGINWREDPISRMISDMTGVNLVIQHGREETPLEPRTYDENGNRVRKGISTFLDVLLASGEFSDLVYLWDEHDVSRMADADMAAPLDELAAQYCPDFWYSLDELEILNNTEEDGHVYTLRNGYLSQGYYEDERFPIINDYHTISMRRDIMKALDLTPPTSFEELEAMLYKVKAYGGSHYITIPLYSNYVHLTPIPNWMGIPSLFDWRVTESTLQWDEEAQRVITPMSDVAWYEYLMKMNQWYRDGILYLPETNPLDPKTDTWETSNQPLNTFATVTYNRYSLYGLHYQLNANANDHSDREFPHYVITEPLTWQGEMKMATSDHNRYPRGAGDGLFISKTCHNKERAILFYQFLRSEDGARLTHWGIEGTHYTRDENGYVTMKEGFTADKRDLNMRGLNDLTTASAPYIGYWTMVANPMVTGIYAASPNGVFTNKDVLAARRILIEAGCNHKKYSAQNRILPLSFAEPKEGEPGYDQYLALKDVWYVGIWEIAKAPTVEMAEERWYRMQEDLRLAGLTETEQTLTLRFIDALKRYQAAGYYTDIVIE